MSSAVGSSIRAAASSAAAHLPTRAVELASNPLFSAIGRGAKVLAGGESAMADAADGHWLRALIKFTAMLSDFARETANAEGVDPFDNTALWVQPFRPELVSIAFSVLRQSDDVQRIELASPAGTLVPVRSVTIARSKSGIAVGWRRTWEQTPSELFCAPCDVAALQREVRDSLRERAVGRIVRAKMQRTVVRWGESWTVEAREIAAHVGVPTAAVERLVSRWRPMIADGVSRSALLAGPPGTGKSTAARAICSALWLNTLQIAVSDVQRFDPNVIQDLVSLYGAEALIVDDIDRIEESEQRQLLSTVEDLRDFLRVIVVTANRPKRLDVACVRPGRFDEIVRIDALDDAGLRAILGDHAWDARDEVREWPVAFVREYSLRRRYLSREEASESMAELRERVAELREAAATAESSDEPRIGSV